MHTNRHMLPVMAVDPSSTPPVAGRLIRFPAGLFIHTLYLLPSTFLAIMAYLHRWVAEDAFIDLRVALHLISGLGPLYNPGERVEAYTNPLWIALLALWGLTGQPLETGAVALGLGCSVGGLLATQAGASVLIRRLDDPLTPAGARMILPFGTIVLAVLPPMWDFATSGLETGLTFGWLGLTFWLVVQAADSPISSPGRHLIRLAYVADRPQRAHWLPAAAVVGLGPLIRPDLALFSAAFLLALILSALQAAERKQVIAGSLKMALAAGALPLAYQLFRMGYFATLVPNTALAKEAGLANWSQGMRYLTNFIGPYQLWVPLALLSTAWVAQLCRALQRRDRTSTVLILAPSFAAGLHAAYIVGIGGDFMHARMLLPALFGLLLPVGVTRPIGLFWSFWDNMFFKAASALLIVWAAVCSLWLRMPYGSVIGEDGIANERTFYAKHAGHANPVVLDDYRAMTWVQDGWMLRRRAQTGTGSTVPAAHRALMLNSQASCSGTTVEVQRYGCTEKPEVPRELPLAPGAYPNARLVVIRRNIGLVGYAAGPHVHIVDRFGLADPLAARLRLERRGRPGHEKALPNEWVVARFSAPNVQQESPAEAAARAAWACGDLATLRQAIEEPLSLRRFLENMRLSVQLTRLRIPADPEQAQHEICRQG
jgi:arabinofuranosyltransferase